MTDYHFSVTTDAEHKAALLQLEHLWNASLGQPRSEELNALIKAVVDYENRQWADASALRPLPG